MYLDNETIEQAKQIDLLTYLRQHDPSNLVKLSGNNYCTREHLLSYATLLKMNGKNWRQDAMLSLAGVFQMKQKESLPVALAQYLMDHHEVQVIHLHLDNDEVERGATEGIMRFLHGRYEKEKTPLSEKLSEKR